MVFRGRPPPPGVRKVRPAQVAPLLIDAAALRAGSIVTVPSAGSKVCWGEQRGEGTKGVGTGHGLRYRQCERLGDTRTSVTRGSRAGGCPAWGLGSVKRVVLS
eukprot:gene19182-biopygen2481